MLTVVCVRQGTKYGPEYVRKLYAMVARQIKLGTEGRFVCFTDQPEDLGPHILTKPLPEGLEGWWCKLWLFRAALFPEGDRILYFDLDTVIVGDLDPIAAYDGEFAILRDFYRPDGLQSAVMAWRSGFGAHIWQRWVKAYRPKLAGGDQEWIERMMREHKPDILQDIYPGLFCSFKIHCHPFPPEGTSVVVFHGEPRPHNCEVPWVKAMWSEGDTGHFQLAMIGNVGLDQIREQSRLSAARGLPRLKSKLAHAESVALVGGGPSLGDPITLAALSHQHAQGCRIWSLNGTHKWLREHGLTPDALVLLDARADNARFLMPEILPETTVYLASQCHPEVYDKAGDHAVRYDLDIMGDCGTTVGTHAILIAFVEGFREIHLYGYDSSYRETEGHAYAQDLNAEDRIVDAHVGERTFQASPWMVRQAQDFDGIARDVTKAGGVIHVHGDGLLPEIARQMTKPMAADIRAAEVLKRVNGTPNPKGAEIGVFFGLMSRRMLEQRNDMTLTMVDSWEGDSQSYEGESGDYHAGLDQANQDEICAKAQEMVAEFGDRARIIRKRSLDAAKDVAPESLDFVFIDADHGYDGCKADIAAWWPKVRVGGIVSGHDYDHPEFPLFGVKRAVDEFSATIGQTPDLGLNYTWFLRRT
jgi:hypothetical protein